MPPVAPAVPVVERDAEGGGGGGLTDGPLDGRTNRGSNPRPRRAPAMAHTTRPSMPLTSLGAKIVFRKTRTGMLCPPNPLRVVEDMCECTLVFKLVFPPWAWHLLLRPTKPHAPPSTSPHCHPHSRRDNSAQSWTLLNPKNVVSRDHCAAVPAAPSVTTTTREHDRLDIQGLRRQGFGVVVRQPRRGVQHRVHCTVAIFRRRAMSMHQAGVYPSGWRPSGIFLSVYLSPSQTALFASQCTSLAVAVAREHGRS